MGMFLRREDEYVGKSVIVMEVSGKTESEMVGQNPERIIEDIIVR